MSGGALTGAWLDVRAEASGGSCSHFEYVDPAHTLVEFGIKHMMFTTVKGRFTGVRGIINCADEADASSASLVAEIGDKLEILIEVQAVRTN